MLTEKRKLSNIFENSLMNRKKWTLSKYLKLINRKYESFYLL